MSKLTIDAQSETISGGVISTELQGYSGLGYVAKLSENGSFVEFNISVTEEAYYTLELVYANARGSFSILIDGLYYGYLHTKPSKHFITDSFGVLFLSKGPKKLKIRNNWGEIDIDSLVLTKSHRKETSKASFELVNKNATKEAKQLMNYLQSIYGKQIITGQHVNVADGDEFKFIKAETGKYPALKGFDFLSYSFETDTLNPSEHHLFEVNGNRGSLEAAIEWATVDKGLVTFCWHWYSPIKGNDKSFYTKFTDFDVSKAVIDGTDEFIALMRDMDYVAEQLKKLQDLNIPVLWRPFHEADGMWFWWGAKGAQPYKKLWHMMYDRYTNHHQLNNLIWVWNAPKLEWHPGEDVVDIVGNDIYVDKGNYGPLTLTFDYTNSLNNGKKPVALTENGAIPDPALLEQTEAHWLWFMTWNGMVQSGDFTSLDQLKKIYNHQYSITLDKLPDIYKD